MIPPLELDEIVDDLLEFMDNNISNSAPMPHIETSQAQKVRRQTIPGHYDDMKIDAYVENEDAAPNLGDLEVRSATQTIEAAVSLSVESGLSTPPDTLEKNSPDTRIVLPILDISQHHEKIRIIAGEILAIAQSPSLAVLTQRSSTKIQYEKHSPAGIIAAEICDTDLGDNHPRYLKGGKEESSISKRPNYAQLYRHLNRHCIPKGKLDRQAKKLIQTYKEQMKISTLPVGLENKVKLACGARPGVDEVRLGDPEEFPVQKILDKSFYQGKWWYWVRWEGYPPEDDTWEPATNLVGGASHAIKEFERWRREPTDVCPLPREGTIIYNN